MDNEYYSEPEILSESGKTWKSVYECAKSFFVNPKDLLEKLYKNDASILWHINEYGLKFSRELAKEEYFKILFNINKAEEEQVYKNRQIELEKRGEKKLRRNKLEKKAVQEKLKPFEKHSYETKDRNSQYVGTIQTVFKKVNFNIQLVDLNELTKIITDYYFKEFDVQSITKSLFVFLNNNISQKPIIEDFGKYYDLMKFVRTINKNTYYETFKTNLERALRDE